ncbi:hypothetical protein F0562_013639 [Nyssa sinensis]|uniref:MYND-type domain-containing protein n=1 Tax=Nyssa sinensis TaxID=561372 RepID=A0A5J4ZKP0_9ASTE|nr:hypothetical protein F0562_013639 [Nyssa sinensis]
MSLDFPSISIGFFNSSSQVLLLSSDCFTLVKNMSLKYFVVDADFDSSDTVSLDDDQKMQGVIAKGDSCVVCDSLTKRQCAGCKLVHYYSEACQSSHWRSEHKTKCKDFQLSGKLNSMQSASTQHRCRSSTLVALVPASGTTKTLKQLEKILFPYNDFVELFNWDKPKYPLYGLLNCGNSCFASGSTMSCIHEAACCLLVGEKPWGFAPSITKLEKPTSLSHRSKDEAIGPFPEAVLLEKKNPNYDIRAGSGLVPELCPGVSTTNALLAALSCLHKVWLVLIVIEGLVVSTKATTLVTALVAGRTMGQIRVGGIRCHSCGLFAHRRTTPVTVLKQEEVARQPLMKGTIGMNYSGWPLNY